MWADGPHDIKNAHHNLIRILFFLSFCFLLIKKDKNLHSLSLGLLLNLFLKLLKIVLGIFKTYITKKSRKGMKKHMHTSSRYVDNKLMRRRANHSDY